MKLLSEVPRQKGVCIETKKIARIQLPKLQLSLAHQWLKSHLCFLASFFIYMYVNVLVGDCWGLEGSAHTSSHQGSEVVQATQAPLPSASFSRGGVHP